MFSPWDNFVGMYGRNETTHSIGEIEKLSAYYIVIFDREFTKQSLELKNSGSAISHCGAFAHMPT